ncbi:glycoside hydrolase [uncultured Draconibacterium sp.]|uniref:glycoside hydrolase n=1 Tax=uncultured Draconibacterium sp. TaxID=1573823 RepID=UPI002AA613A2|nr:glycoside hydrolase [uncultured Draconibacterium sp.]
MKSILIILSVLLSLPLLAQNNKVAVQVNPDKTYQSIQNFGASDSWRAQFVGENWPVEKREKIADLLFSLDTDKNGNPIGIGLSNWRFYIGAGSMEQGDASDIVNVWRRSECFLDADGNYDWTKYKGQRWFLQAAKKRGVPEFTAYSISPPVFFTKNGLAHATKGDLGFNLKEDKYEAYSKFLVDVVEHFEKNENIHFAYLSPFNEPQWAWDASNQEGTPATNNELYKYTRILSEELNSRGSETKLLFGEAGDVEYLYKEKGNNSNGDQINVFFNPKSDMYIGDLKNLEYAITSHSYFTTWPIKAQIEYRQKLAERLNQINPELDFWQTEFCILEKNDETTGGWGRDTGMPTALYVARVIHSDLTIANARSWDWWTALSQFNYKDGLVHLDDGKGPGVNNDTSQLNYDLRFDGEITETKLLWAMGNYSRFVRPDMVRIDAKIDNGLPLVEQATDLQVAAFKELSSGKLVFVFMNYKDEDKPVSLAGITQSSDKAALYITDETRDLEKSTVQLSELVIPQRSVSTLVIEK